MAINDIVQTIAEARVDARSLSEFVFKPAGFKVARRLAPTVDTLQFYINRFNSLNGDFTSSVSVALSSLSNSVAEADGKVAYIETTVQDAITNTVISSGFITIDSFELGATLTQRNQALRHAADGKMYRWAGDLPKVVPASSTPTISGGMGDNAWLEVNDATLRSEIGDLGFANVIISNRSPSPDDGILNDLYLRTQTNSPDEIDNLFYWLDAGTIEANNYDRVSSWVSRGGSLEGFSIYNQDEESQPQYFSEGFGFKPALKFDRSRVDRLQGEHSVVTGGQTRFLVMLVEEGTDVIYDGFSSSKVTPIRNTMDYDSVDGFDNSFNMLAGSFLGFREDLPIKPSVFCNVISSSSNNLMRYNGVEVARGGGGTSSIEGFSLGCRHSNTRGMSGYIAEVIFYNRELTIGEIKDVERYLSDKYRIAASPSPVPAPAPDPELLKLYHFDAGDLTLNDQDPVSSWDSSEGDIPLTISNSDPSSQPTYISSGDAGLPCVRFNKSLNTRLFSSHTPIHGEVTLFMVARIEEGSDTIFDGTSESDRFCLWWQAGSLMYQKTPVQLFNRFRQPLPIPTTVMVGRIGIGGSHRVDGFSSGGGATVSQQPIESLLLGCRYTLNRGASMDVYEFILYSGLATEEQTKKIEDELAYKYRIKLAR